MTRYVRFDSLTALEEFCSKEMYERNNSDFVGRDIRSYDEAITYSRKVWTDGITLYDRLYAQLKDAIKLELKSSKRKTSFSADDGDNIDYDRLIAGEQEFWRKSQRESTEGPTTVTVMVHTTTPGVWNAEDAMWRGLAGIVIAELLEEAGHQVEIRTVGANDFHTKTVTHCLLKSCSDPLDRSSMINALSTWYHRTIRFNSLFTINNRKGSLPIADLDQDDLDQITPDLNRVLISHISSFNGAVELVKAEIERLETAVS